MCGIAGVYRMGDTPIKPETLNVLFLGMEHRGTDASGISILNPEGKVHVHKAPEMAWKFLATEAYKDFVKEHLKPETRCVLIHTRAATSSGFGGGGSYHNNVNNHPMWMGVTAAVHNGMIHNHKELFGEFKLERSCETDSDIIRAILDEEGFTRTAVRRLERMNGSAAFAAVSTHTPDKLLIGRCGNPIVMGADMERNHLMWASEKAAVHAASRDWVKQWGMWMQRAKSTLLWRTIPDDTVYLIGPEGQEWHQQFKTTAFFRPANYSKQYTEWGKRHTTTTTPALSNVRKPGEQAPPAPDANTTSLEDPDVADAETLVQCEHCEKWNYFTLNPSEFDISDAVCGFCSELCRKATVLSV